MYTVFMQEVPSMKERPMTMPFSYSGETIIDLAREAYWFENRRKWAIRVLKKIRVAQNLDQDQLFYMMSRGLNEEQVYDLLQKETLSDEQIEEVLNGGFTVIDSSF